MLSDRVYISACHFHLQTGIKTKMNARNLMLPAFIFLLLNTLPCRILCLLFQTMYGQCGRILQKIFLLFNLIVVFFTLFFLHGRQRLRFLIPNCSLCRLYSKRRESLLDLILCFWEGMDQVSVWEYPKTHSLFCI